LRQNCRRITAVVKEAKHNYSCTGSSTGKGGRRASQEREGRSTPWQGPLQGQIQKSKLTYRSLSS
jgi:hypothetical protein